MSMDDQIGTRVLETITVEMSREDACDVLWALEQGLWLYDSTFPAGEFERHEAIHERMKAKIKERKVEADERAILTAPGSRRTVLVEVNDLAAPGVGVRANVRPGVDAPVDRVWRPQRRVLRAHMLPGRQCQ